MAEIQSQTVAVQTDEKTRANMTPELLNSQITPGQITKPRSVATRDKVSSVFRSDDSPMTTNVATGTVPVLDLDDLGD